MSKKIWGISEDGRFEYVSLTKDHLDGALEVMRKAFFLHESISIAVELHKHPNAIKELEELTLRAVNDGVSIIAVEKSTGIVAGAAFNKLQVPALPGAENYFENFESKCNEASSKALVRFMIEADAECDLFEHCQVDCILEIMFLATLEEYRGNGIGKKVCEYSIALGKELLAGNNVKTPIDGQPLALTPVPKIVAAIYTSNVSQKIGTALGFEKAVQIDYNRWSFNGKTFAQRIGPETPKTSLEYFKL